MIRALAAAVAAIAVSSSALAERPRAVTFCAGAYCQIVALPLPAQLEDRWCVIRGAGHPHGIRRIESWAPKCRDGQQ